MFLAIGFEIFSTGGQTVGCQTIIGEHWEAPGPTLAIDYTE